MMKYKLIRTSTVSMSLDILLKGQLAFLNNFYSVIAVSGADDYLQNVANREKVKTISVGMQRQISPIKDFISLVNLFLVFKKEKPLIVHSITPKAGLLSMIAGYIAGVPIRIHTFTGLIFPSKTGFTKQVLILMDKILCRFATNIIPEGNGVKNDLLKYKITNKPLKIIANGNVNGVDTTFFNPELVSNEEKLKLKKQLSISEDDFVFIFVGRLVKDKGINELIAAFSILSNKNKNCKLLLVGNFEQELDPLKFKTINEIKLNKNIISVGFQTDVRLYFAISKCLVFPSYREGFPNVVLQAGAMNLPSIVSDINGCNEIITNKLNGIIIPSKNEDVILEAMNSVLNIEFYNSITKQSREVIVNKFEQKIVWEAILAEYRKFEK
jgi:glycosyltransferase involved in cell wall biosynthesis